MTTYTAHYRTEAEYALHEIEAATPEQALQLARDLWEIDPNQLDFAKYDMLMPLDEIEVEDDAKTCTCVWQSEEFRLRVAAPDLLEALEELVERERAEAAVSGFTDDEMTWLEDARRAIAKAKGT